MGFFDKLRAWFAGDDAPREDAPKPDASAEPAASPPSPSPPLWPAPSQPPHTAAPVVPVAPVAPVVPVAPVKPAQKKPPQRASWSQKDDARLEREARERFDAGHAAGAIAFLDESAILFARHDTTTRLPCLCKACVSPAVDHAEVAGVVYVRDFVVTQLRVLFYWMPSEIADDAAQVRASMRSELRARLRRRARREDVSREIINPFTKERVTVMPKRQRYLHPFTGKPLP